MKNALTPEMGDKMRPAKDPELAREVIRSLRTELGPPQIPWSAALEFERATQMWSQRRRNS